jgi:hypothetical protein
MSPDTPASDSLHEGLSVSESPTRVVASFWRRIFAFLVDVVITAVPCALVGFTFHRFFAESKLADLDGHLLMTPNDFSDLFQHSKCDDQPCAQSQSDKQPASQPNKASAAAPALAGLCAATPGCAEGVAVVAGIGLLGGLVFKAVEIAYQSPVAPTGNIMLDALNPPNVFAPVQNQKTSDNTEPKAADAAGVTAGGQATNKYGDKLGPSGEVQVNQARHSTEKGAKDAARQEGAGAPEKHVNPTKGGPHYHPTDKQGKKIPSSTHHNYPD